MSSRPIRNTTAPDRYGNPRNTEAAVGGLNVADLIMPGASSLELDQARIRWADPVLTRENAKSKQDFNLIQALAACAAFAVPRSDVIDISSDEKQDDAAVAQSPQDEEQDDAAVAQSPQAPPSTKDVGLKRARPVTLQDVGRTSMARLFDRSTHPQFHTGVDDARAVVGRFESPAAGARQDDSQDSVADAQEIVTSSLQAGGAGNSDENDGWIQDDGSQDIIPSSSQASDADSQDIIRSSSQASEASSQSSVRAAWSDSNSVNGTAATADDANEVPVFGGNGAGRTFAVQPDGSALRTDTEANGTQQTSRWKLIGHSQWQKHDKDNV